MALIARPMLDDAPDDLAMAMAESGHDEWAWRDALLAFFPAPFGQLEQVTDE